MKNHRKEIVGEFLRSFLPALSHAHQYTSSHQLAVSSRNTAYRHLSEVLAETSMLSVKIVENRIVADEEPLEDAIYVGRFIEYFMTRGIQYIRIQRGIDIDELAAFIESMNSYNPLTMADMEWTFPHIQIGKVGLGVVEEKPEESEEGFANEGEDEETDENSEALKRFEKVFNEDLDLMIDVYDAVRAKHDLPATEISRVVADIITAVRQESGLLMSFSPLRALDEYTFTHSTNVCILTIAQAMSLGIKDETLHDIGVAAMLHDIGKIFVPVEILNKKGKPTGTIICVDPHTTGIKDFANAKNMKTLNMLFGVQAILKTTLADVYTTTSKIEEKDEKEASFATSKMNIDIYNTDTGVILKQLTGRNPIFLSKEKGDLSTEKAKIKAIDLTIEMIAEDLLRAVLSLDWHARIASVEEGKVIINAGRLSGLETGKVLEVYTPGEEITDVKTGLPLGTAKGSYKGEVEVGELFGVDACRAIIKKGAGFSTTDLVYVKQQ